MKNFLNKTWERIARGARARIRLARARPLRVVVFLAAFAPVVAFWPLAARIYKVIDSRIQTFHELEMYEGDMALQAIRILNGQQLYPSRESDYIPLLYTPLYSYLNALAMKWLDPPGEPHTLYAGRVVSLMATIGIMLILFAWVWRETQSLVCSIGAALLFDAINPLVGWWFDIARVDMLHVLFAAAGSWAFLDRRSPCRRTEIMKGCLAGFFFTCAFYTKQTGGQIALGMTLLAFGVSPLRALWGMAAGATIGGFAWIYLMLSNTDLFYLTVTVPTRHYIDLTNWEQRLKSQVFTPAAVSLAVIAAWTFLAVVRGRWRHVLIAAGTVWTGYFCLRGALTIGGYLNHYLPIWFYICLGVGIAAGTMLPEGTARPRGGIARACIIGLALAVALGFHLKFKGWGLPITLALVLTAVGARAVPASRPLGLWPGRVSLIPVLLFVLIAFDIGHHTNAREFKPYREKWTFQRESWPKFKFEWNMSFLGMSRPWVSYDANNKIPAELDGARRLIRAIHDLNGNLWIPHANYYCYLVGRPTDISTDHVRDVAMANVPVPRYVINMLNQRKYTYILINNPNLEHDWQANEVRDAIRANYVVLENWDTKFGWRALMPVDMTAQKPRALMIRKDMAPNFQVRTAE